MSGITDLTLYHLDTGLAELLAYRDDRLADTEDPPGEEELAAVDGQIREYLAALPAKVSGVCAIFRLWKSQQAAIRAEEERLYAIRKRVEANEARLKEYCAEILERQPEPAKGSKRLTGADGSVLSLRGNGGVQPLQVDPAKVPSEYFDVTVRVPNDVWTEFTALLNQSNPGAPYQIMSTEPSNHRIREALAQPCPQCNGRGRLEYEPDKYTDCGSCGGTGKQGVPGATLLERGKHVEIK